MEMEILDTMRGNIPNDVVIEILLRLPAKSLLLLRWACKYWLDLISRDSFIKMHLLLQQHSTAINPCSVLISNPKIDDGTTSYKLFQCYLNYYDDISGHEAVMIPHSLDLPVDAHCEILGSCNGLILFKRRNLNRNLCIWNPCTKECRDLPPLLSPRYCYREHYNYGFNYDRTTDDYIVITNAYGAQHDLVLNVDVQVFTLSRNLWRRISHRPYKPTSYQGFELSEKVCVNGVLYWIDSKKGKGDIISFNVRMEKFRQVLKIPKVIDKEDCVKLQVFQGCLCVVLDMVIEQCYHVEMWVMKDYGVDNKDESLWTKLFTFRNLNNYPSYAKPLRFTNSGELLMVKNQKELVLYDPKTNRDRILFSVCEEPSHFIEEVYVESLASLNSGTYTSILNTQSPASFCTRSLCWVKSVQH